MTQETRDAWLEASREARKDPRHPVNDARPPQHADALAEFEAMIMGGADNPPIGELFEGARIRPLGADALSPAPRPPLTGDRAWDEAAVVLGEIEARAGGLPPYAVMAFTTDLAAAVNAADEQGVVWSQELGEAELIRRYSRESAQHRAEQARVVLEILSESDHDALAQGVKRLAAERGNDPNVVDEFAALMGHLETATPTPRLEALLLRRAERSMKADAEARARAAKVQQDQAAEDEAALADAMTGVADRHRRWGRSE